MVRQIKFISLLLLALLAALGTMGVGYGSWQQGMGVTGSVQPGTWNSADFASIEISGAPDCTIESISEKSVTFKIHFKDNSRHDYSGSIVCPIINGGTVPVLIDTVQITKIGPDKRDPSAGNLTVTATGALVESNHQFLGSHRLEQAGLMLSGNPYKGDYLITVSFTTVPFNSTGTP
jgi:hypothetical protein